MGTENHIRVCVCVPFYIQINTIVTKRTVVYLYFTICYLSQTPKGTENRMRVCVCALLYTFQQRRFELSLVKSATNRSMLPV